MRRIGVFSFGHLLQPVRGCGTFELLCFNSKLTKIRRDESKERRVYKSVFNEMNCYLSLMTTPFFKKKICSLNIQAALDCEKHKDYDFPNLTKNQ